VLLNFKENDALILQHIFEDAIPSDY